MATTMSLTRFSTGTRSNGHVLDAVDLAGFVSAETAVLMSGMMSHSTRSTFTTLPPE